MLVSPSDLKPGTRSVHSALGLLAKRKWYSIRSKSFWCRWLLQRTEEVRCTTCQEGSKQVLHGAIFLAIALSPHLHMLRGSPVQPPGCEHCHHLDVQTSCTSVRLRKAANWQQRLTQRAVRRTCLELRYTRGHVVVKLELSLAVGCSNSSSVIRRTTPS